MDAIRPREDQHKSWITFLVWGPRSALKSKGTFLGSEQLAHWLAVLIRRIG